MRILLITEFFPTGKDLRFSGGVEARTFFIAKYLSKKHQVVVLASKTKGIPRKEKLLNFTVFRVGPARGYTASVGHLVSRILFIKDAIRFGKTLDVDIVDGGNYISHFIGKQIALYKKVPIVAWYPDVWLNDWFKNAGFYGLFGEILERLNLFRGFDSYIAISKQTAFKLNKFIRRKAEVIYCGVDKDEFSTRLKKFKDPTILCISRLAKYKNIKTLILAFAHLSMKIKNAKLMIVGEGPELKNLKNLANNLKITKKVKFLSNVPRKDLINLYKSSHIFCLPSLVEGFGIATIEAATSGLAYVNSDTLIAREITKNGKGGYLVDPQNPIAYSEKFEKLLKDEKIYKRKSSDAKNLATLYNWQDIAFQTEQIYLKLLK